MIKKMAIATVFMAMSFLGAHAAPFGAIEECKDRFTFQSRGSVTSPVSEFRLDSFSVNCPLDGYGSVNETTDTGSAFLNTSRPDTPVERYAVDLSGSLGASLFGMPLGVPNIPDLLITPPDFRLIFKPDGGRDTSFLFPNGFSVSRTCSSTEGSSDCDFSVLGPFFLVGTDSDSRISSFFSDGGGPSVISAVPLPPTLPLVAVALFALFGWRWLGRRNGSIPEQSRNNLAH